MRQMVHLFGQLVDAQRIVDVLRIDAYRRIPDDGLIVKHLFVHVRSGHGGGRQRMRCGRFDGGFGGRRRRGGAGRSFGAFGQLCTVTVVFVEGRTGRARRVR